MKNIICPKCYTEFPAGELIRYKVFREKFNSLHRWLIKRRAEAAGRIERNRVLKGGQYKERLHRSLGHKAALESMIEMVEGRYGKHLDK